MTRVVAAKDAELTKIPQHVAIIMDGNGRWARRRRLPRVAGHRRGAENVLEIAKSCIEFGLPMLTVYAFSTENWSRPRREVEALMGLLEEAARQELNELMANGIRLRVLGRLEVLPPSVQERMDEAIALSRHNRNLNLNVAFNYGGRAEVVDAFKRIMRDGRNEEEITEELVSSYLYTADLPDPDLVIRTAGEMRLSNFLIWQAAYAEYYSTPTYWPDFDRAELLRALQAYSQRRRRFGGVEERG